jgi:hypothetical protein
MLHTMTEQQATQKAEEYAHGAMATLPPEARVKPMYSPQSPCDDPTDNGPKGRIEVGRDYSVENDNDGFRMSIEGGRTGAVSIGASSPCVWPNGTPPPSVISGWLSEP